MLWREHPILAINNRTSDELCHLCEVVAVTQANHPQPIRGSSRCCRLSLLLALLLVGTGCNGFSDYETKMDQAQKRVKYLDDENSHLEPNPLKLPPPKKDEKEPPVQPNDVFFRPPKGVHTESDPNAKPLGGILYVYPSNNPAFEKLLFAAVKTENPAKFQADVVKALKLPGPPGPARWKELGKQIGRPVQIECFPDASPKSPRIFFARDDFYLLSVAIVFLPPSPAEGSTGSVASNESQLIDYSLGSLLLGNNALRKLAKWKPPSAESGKTRSIRGR
jgi:hypothetical protein